MVKKINDFLLRSGKKKKRQGFLLSPPPFNHCIEGSSHVIMQKEGTQIEKEEVKLFADYVMIFL
jgi:hypothetical protein